MNRSVSPGPNETIKEEKNNGTSTDSPTKK
jgi:hypothetical protein